jgi:ATP-dependent Clp protease protease subunit
MDCEDDEKASEKKSRLDDKIDDALLKARRLFFSDAVTSETARDAIRKLWYLELTDPGKPILFVINSPGGSVDAGFAIVDQVKMITSPVITLVTGLAASMGSILMLCGQKKQRYATPNARIMIHQPRIGGAIQGQATDLAIHAKEIIKTRNKIIEMYVEATGKDFKEVEKAIDRDTWLSAEEAKKWGLITSVATSFSDIK